MAGHVLDRPHPVEGHAGGGHDRAARLGGDPDGRRGSRPRRQAAPHRAGPLGHGRRLLTVHVGHPQPAPDAPARADRAGRRTRPGSRRPGRTARGRRPGCRGGRGCPTNSTTRRRPGRPAAATAAAAAPDARPKPNLESSCPVRTNSWVWTSTPGVMRASTSAATARRLGVVGPPRAAGRHQCSMRSISSKESTMIRPTPTARARGQLLGRTCCCRAARGGRPGRRRSGPRGARRPSTRRGTSPPRGPAGPWPRTGRPWWRRPLRRPRPRRPPGRRSAGGPRRRRTAACRARRRARARRSPPIDSRPSSPMAAVRGQQRPVDRPGRDGHGHMASGACTPRRPSADGQADACAPRPATAAPGPGPGRRRRPGSGSRGRSRGSTTARRRTQVVTLVGARSTAASATTSGSSSRQRSSSSSRGWIEQRQVHLGQRGPR